MKKKSAAGRKIILGVAVSLDGFIEGPKGEYDWCFSDQDYGMSDFMKRIDTIFMGRKTYELAQSMGSAGNPWKGISNYVFSNSLKEVTGKENKLVSGDLVPSVNAIRQQPGKDIWMFGGAELTTSMMNKGLIDEFWLAIHPIVLGSGKPLFQNLTSRQKLGLIESKTYNTGLISAKYELV